MGESQSDGRKEREESKERSREKQRRPEQTQRQMISVTMIEAERQSELEAISMKANDVVDESLESTRRMLALCEESKEAGIKTLVALDDQGEQLDHIEEGLDTINNEMKQAERALKRMGKCCGICILPWQR